MAALIASECKVEVERIQRTGGTVTFSVLSPVLFAHDSARIDTGTITIKKTQRVFSPNIGLSLSIGFAATTKPQVQTIMGVPRVNGDLAVSRAFGDAQHKKTGGPKQDRSDFCRV